MVAPLIARPSTSSYRAPRSALAIASPERVGEERDATGPYQRDTMTHSQVSRLTPAREALAGRRGPVRAAPLKIVRSHAPEDTRRRVDARRVVLASATVALVAMNVAGARYYLADQAHRVRDPLHAWLRPSGYVGQSAGILAALIFGLLWLYPLRKRWKALAFTGAIGKWLDLHVTAALLLPPLLTIHSAWRADGLIGLGFTAMLVVWSSGIVGRYLYTRIPRAKSGIELTRDELAAGRHERIDRLATALGLAPDELRARIHAAGAAPGQRQGVLAALGMLVTNDLRRWRLTRELRALCRTDAPANRMINRRALDEAVRLASREISLSQQVKMLDATHRLFRYWHVAHRPFAVTALVAVVVHVAVVTAMGVTWLR